MTKTHHMWKIVLKTNKLCRVASKTKSEPETTLCYRAYKLNVFQIKNQEKRKEKINIIPKYQGIYKFESSYECVAFTLCPSPQIILFLK